MRTAGAHDGSERGTRPVGGSKGPERRTDAAGDASAPTSSRPTSSSIRSRSTSGPWMIFPPRKAVQPARAAAASPETRTNRRSRASSGWSSEKTANTPTDTETTAVQVAHVLWVWTSDGSTKVRAAATSAAVRPVK